MYSCPSNFPGVLTCGDSVFLRLVPGAKSKWWFPSERAFCCTLGEISGYRPRDDLRQGIPPAETVLGEVDALLRYADVWNAVASVVCFQVRASWVPLVEGEREVAPLCFLSLFTGVPQSCMA